VEEHQRRLASVKLRGAHVHARTFVCDAAITGTQGAGAMLASDVLPLRFAGLFASRRALLALVLAAGGSGQPLLATDGQRDGPHDGQPAALGPRRADSPVRPSADSPYVMASFLPVRRAAKEILDAAAWTQSEPEIEICNVPRSRRARRREATSRGSVAWRQQEAAPGLRDCHRERRQLANVRPTDSGYYILIAAAPVYSITHGYRPACMRVRLVVPPTS
jgi:hypothetical protein